MNNSKIEKNKAKIESVKKIQTKNIEAVLAQAEKLKILEEKAEVLEEEAEIFSKKAHELKMKMTWQRKKDQMVVLGIVFCAVTLSYIIGSSIQVVLITALIGGVIFGGLYGNEGAKQKKEKLKSNALKPNAEYEKKKKKPISSPIISNPSIKPSFNNFKNEKNKKSYRSENKISYVPKK